MRNKLKLESVVFFAFLFALVHVPASFADSDDIDLLGMELFDPFPKAPKPIDPIEKKPYQHVVAGPSYRAPRGAGFDYYRYVTFYDVSERKERVHSLPIQRENCHDKSDGFASYSFSYSFSASISAEIGVKGLGLSGTLTESRTVSTSRDLRATGNIVADHVPYFLKQDWSGLTFVQVYHLDTGKTGYLVKVSNRSPYGVRMIAQPALYPYGFEIRDADWVFMVERNILSSCPN